MERYEILAPIAAGGMATVYVGRVRGAAGFARLVALKRPHPFVAVTPELRRQLEEEARIAALLHHPNVVPVLDVDEGEGDLVLVLEYVEGCTLGRLAQGIEASPRYLPSVLRAVLDAAAGLHAAHRLRDVHGHPLDLVHRDVCPHNVLVSVDGVAKIADFGIAKMARGEREETSEGVLKGKLAYMPPEYLLGGRFDARSDQYALGIVTWELLGKQRLFKGVNEVETIERIRAGRVPRLADADARLAPFDAVLAHALASEPADRYDSVLAFADALEKAAAPWPGVASREELSAAVEEVAGPVLAERRAAIAGTTPAPSPVAARKALPRDDVATASLPAAHARAIVSEPPRPAPETPQKKNKARVVAPIAAVVVAAAAIVAIALPRARAPGPDTAPSAAAATAPSVEPSASSEGAPETASAPSDVAPAPSSPPARSTPAHRAGHGGAAPARRPTPALPSAPRRAPPNPYAHGSP